MFLLSRDLFIIVGVILSSLLIDNYEIKPYFSGKFNSFVLMTYLGFVIIEVSFGLVPEVFLNFLIPGCTVCDHVVHTGTSPSGALGVT